jgi:hypothetical protein
MVYKENPSASSKYEYRVFKLTKLRTTHFHVRLALKEKTFFEQLLRWLLKGQLLLSRWTLVSSPPEHENNKVIMFRVI